MFKKILIYLSFIAIAFTQTSGLNDAFNQFGIDLFKELNSETDSDVLISPTSIAYALMMTNLGATGSTSENILSVLNLSDFREEYYSDLSNYIQKSKENNIEFANAIWIQDDRCYLPNTDYISRIKSIFNGQVNYVNFYDNRIKIIDQINEWVDSSTYGMIKNIVSDNHIKRNTKQALLNTIYFKSNWQHLFDSLKTENKIFFTDQYDGLKTLSIPGQTFFTRRSITVPIMNHSGRYFHYKHKYFHFLDIPYQNNDISMLIFLPDNQFHYNSNGISYSLNDFIEIFNNELIKSSIDSSKFEKGNIWIPKFEIEYSSSLKDVLRLMGMDIPFNMQLASFDNFWNYDNECKKNRPRHYIDVINHKTHITVDESGTEAAAATAVVINRVTSIDPNKKPFIFNANRPFLYLIYDKKNQNILFLGTHKGKIQ